MAALTFMYLILVVCINLFSVKCNGITEMDALLDVKMMMIDPQTFMTAWDPSLMPDMCQWPDVECNDDRHVVSM